MSNLKFFREDVNTYVWKNFFKRFPNKNDVILDFGCGVGWSIVVGRNLGFEVYGVDVEYKKTDPLYRFHTFREDLGISKYVKIYDGVEPIPFDDDTFSIIVCRASLMKYTLKATSILSKEELVKRRVLEFMRIYGKDKTLVVTPYGYGHKTSRKLKARGVKILGWNNHPLIKKFHKENPNRIIKEGE